MTRVVLALAVLAAAPPAAGAPVAWTGGGDGTSWSDPANWDSAAVPGPADDVTISAGASVAASASTAVVVSSLDLGGALRLSTGALVSGLFVVRAGSTLTFASTQAVRAGTFRVASGGLVEAHGPIAQSTVAVTVSAGLLELLAGSTVQASGRGLAGGSALSPGSGTGGGGSGTGISGAGGGGHGGAGGPGGLAANGGSAYGSAADPTTEGSGGGGGLAPCFGGAGGGRVSLSASTAALDGLVLADGAAGTGGCSQAGGGGAGGAIRVSAASLTGGGSLFARGGNGGSGGGGRGGGGGGGGRVAVLTTGLNLASVAISSGAGLGGSGTDPGTNGSPGTAFVDPKVWTGAGSGDCKDPANWVSRVPPLPFDNIVFGSTAAAKGCAWDFSLLPVGTLTVEPGYQGILSWNTLLSSVTGRFLMQGGTLTVTNVDLKVGGDFIQTGGAFSLSNGSVTLTGAGRTLSVLPASRFNHLVVENGASATFASSVSVGGDLTVRASGALSVSSGTVLRASGQLTQLGSVSAAGSEFLLDGTAPQRAAWSRFGALRVASSSGVFLLPGASTSTRVEGDLSIEPGASLAAQVGRVELTGHWASSGSFSASGATVAFVGTSPQAILSGATQFHYLECASAGGVLWSTSVEVSSGVVFSAGTADLGTATHTARGRWTASSGTFSGSSGTVLFAGGGLQTVTASPGSTFGRLVSSNPAGVFLAADAEARGDVELHAGVLDLGGRRLTLRGSLSRLGAPGPAATGSTVALSGDALQRLALGGAALGSLQVSNSSAGARLEQPLVVRGTFAVDPGAVFDGASSSLTLSGPGTGWDTAGADYRRGPSHAVLWQSPGPGGVTVAAGSTVAARVDVTGLARLAGRLHVSSGPLVVQSGGTLDGRGGTVTLRGASELFLGAGSAYLRDAGSWIVYEGSGAGRGAGLSTGPVGSLLLASADPNETFAFQSLDVDGSLVVSSGVAALQGGARLTVRGDLLSSGGRLDLWAGTVTLAGAALQALSPAPADAFGHLELASSSAAALASGAVLRLGGNLTLASGTLRGGDAVVFLEGDWTGLGGSFSAQGSTVAFSSAGLQAYRDVLHQTFNGLSAGPGTRAFASAFDAAVLSATHPAAALTFSTSAVHAVGALRVNGVSTTTPVSLRSALAGTPFRLSVAGSTVTAAALRDLDAAGGALVHANDGRSRDDGGNSGVEFRPALLVIVPGETFLPGTGRAGTALAQTAGSTFAVTVQAVSDAALPVDAASMTVTLRTDDPFDAEPAPAALSAGATTFSVALRRAEPEPGSAQAWAEGPAVSGVSGSTVPVQSAAFSGLLVLMPGESAQPGSPSGRSGGSDFQVAGRPLDVVVRAVDAFGNIKTGVTDTVAVAEVTGASAALPAPAALSAGSVTLSGLVVHSTGVFTLQAADLSSAALAQAQSSTFPVFALSASSPSLQYSLPSGASVGTIRDVVTGSAADSVAVTQVAVAVRDNTAGLWFDWTAAFNSTVPVTRPAVVDPFRGTDTVWTVPFPDQTLVSGRSYLVSLRAENPSGLSTVVESTITFDRSILLFAPGDGQGSASVAPASTAACQAVVATVTFTVGAAGLGPGGAVALRLPSGWTPLGGLSSALPPPLGYVTVVSTSLAWTVAGSSEAVAAPVAVGSVTLGADWVAVKVRAGAPNPFLPGEEIKFHYHGLPPARAVGRHVLDLRSRAAGSGTLVAVTTAPALTLAAGPARGLEFAAAEPLALGLLQTSPTMQLALTDGCGNPAVAAAPVSAALSAGRPGESGFAADATAAFFLVGASVTPSVTVAAGSTLSEPFYARTATAGVDSEFLRATAAVSGVPAEALRLVLVRASSVTPAGLSIATGTLSAGATSAVLSPGTGARALVRFTLADPSLPWDVALATEPGFTSPLARWAGYGDAARPVEVPLDGVLCGRACSFLAPGRYHVRARAGGTPGPALELRVATTPFVGGSLGSSGAGALLRVEGPGAGYGASAAADASGTFRIDGLRAGERYAVRASSARLVYGLPLTLSTAVFSVAASTDGGVADAALELPALIRVSASLPVLTRVEVFGSARARRSDGALAASGALRVPRAGATSDDGATAVGLAASTWTVLAVEPGTYSVEVDLAEMGLSTVATGVAASTAAPADLALSMPRLATLSGVAVLPSTQAYGTEVAVSAARSGADRPERFATALIAAASSGTVPSSGVFSLPGLDPGTWTLTAQARGFLPSTSAIFIAGSADVGEPGAGAGGPVLTLGLGAVLRGTVTFSGDSRSLAGTGPAPDAASSPGFSVLVDAFEPSLLRRVSAVVSLATSAAQSSAPYELSGLEPGRWVLRLETPAVPRAALPAPQEVAVTSAGAAADLSVSEPDMRLRLWIKGAADFAALSLLEEAPDADDTALGRLDLLSGTYETFPSSLSLTLTLPRSAARRYTLLERAGGRRASAVVAASSGLVSAGFELSGATYAVSGRVELTGAVRLSSASFAVTLSSMPGLVAHAPRLSYCLLSSSVPVSFSAARVELIPLGEGFPQRPGPLAPAGAQCLSWDVSRTTRPSVVAYAASLGADGSFRVSSVPAGVYLVRVPGDLDGAPGNGDEAAPVERALVVDGDESLVLSLGPGAEVRGSLALPPGAPARRPLTVTLSGGGVTRSAVVEAAPEAAAAFSLGAVPDGDYLLGVRDPAFPPTYGARPRRLAVAGPTAEAGTLLLERLGAVRGRVGVTRTTASGTVETSLIGGGDRTLLPPALRVAAAASPWVDGGFFPALGTDCASDGCRTTTLDADGRFLIPGVLPGLYDVELTPASEGAGADLAPAAVSGVRVEPGVTVDLGVAVLRGAAAVFGLLRDAATGLPAGDVPVTARPTAGAALAGRRRPASATRSGADGRFVLGGLDPEARYYDVVAAPRPGPDEPVPAFEQTVIGGVDLRSTATLVVSLRAAPHGLSGRAASEAGEALFSASDGERPEPGARVSVAREGRPPLSAPLGDVTARSAPDGTFSVPSLPAGSYLVTVEALGHAPRRLAVSIATAEVSLGTLTLSRAARLEGSLRRPDGTAPGEDEVRRVFAAAPDLSELLPGGLVRDGRSVTGYRVSGFVPGRTYRLVLLTSDDEPVTPPEASALAFSTTTEARRLDVVFRTPPPRVTAKSRRSGSRYLVEFQVSQPLRSLSSADGQAGLLASTVSALGTLSGAELSSDRRRLSAVYTPAVGESSFTLRFAARTSSRDPEASDGGEFLAVATAAVFSGLDGYHATRVANLAGATLGVDGDPGRVSLPKGAFLVDASSSVAIALRRSDELLTGAAALAASGLAPAEAARRSLRLAPAAYPEDLLRAMAATPPDVRPAGPYYDVLLGAGVPERLARPAKLTLGYSADQDPSRLNVYWYNEAANAFVLQQDVSGAPLEVDSQNRTVSLSVDHFSTFVLFDAAAALISGNAFTGGSLTAYNFPNPFDLKGKTVTPIHGAGPQAVRGTMIRLSVPPGLDGDARIMVFSAAGERVRTLDLGRLAGGRTYYQPWDGANDSGRDVASGLYIGQAKVGSQSVFFKLAVLK